MFVSFYFVLSAVWSLLKCLQLKQAFICFILVTQSDVNSEAVTLMNGAFAAEVQQSVVIETSVSFVSDRIPLIPETLSLYKFGAIVCEKYFLLESLCRGNNSF